MRVYCHMSKKSRVGRSGFFFSLLSAKPEIVVPGSGIRFRYFIFEICGKLTNYAHIKITGMQDSNQGTGARSYIFTSPGIC